MNSAGLKYWSRPAFVPQCDVHSRPATAMVSNILSTPAPLPHLLCPILPRSRNNFYFHPATVPQQSRKSRIHIWSSRNSRAIVVDRLWLMCTPNLIYFINYFSSCVIETFNNWHSNGMYRNTTRRSLFIDFIWTKWNKTEIYFLKTMHYFLGKKTHTY